MNVASIRKRFAVLFQIVVGALVVLYVAGAMLFDPVSTALRLVGGAFGVAFALASVTFSYARTELPTALRREATFAGERLLLASVMFLLASLCKYGSEAVPRHLLSLLSLLKRLGEMPERQHGFNVLFSRLLNLMAFVSAGAGALQFESGLSRLSGIVAHKSRRSAHPGYFITAEAYRKSLDRLTADDPESLGGSAQGEGPASILIEGKPPASP